MAKKIILSVLALVVIPTIIFLPVYALMAHTIHNDLENFQDVVIGEWEGIQFYHNKERFVCDDENRITIIFNDDEMVINGSVLSEGTYPYTWTSPTSLSIDYEGNSRLFVFSHTSNGNLQIAVEGLDYTLVLRSSTQE